MYVLLAGILEGMLGEGCRVDTCVHAVIHSGEIVEHEIGADNDHRVDTGVHPTNSTASARDHERERGMAYTASSSTSKISVAFGGITPPAPRAP